MKLNTKLTIISIIIFISAYTTESRRQDVASAREKAQFYVPFAQLPYCSADAVRGQSCQICTSTSQLGYQVIHVENQIKEGVPFSMVILKNQGTSEVIVSFAGPKSDSIAYFQKIYTSGLIPVPEIGNTEIETEFWQIYSMFFRQVLTSQITSQGLNSKITFVGHSFGGSVAMLAAYDLVLNNVIIKNAVNGPFIYTFGALKIGSHDFLSKIQNLMGAPIVRIRRRVDFFTLLPRCIFMGPLRVFHCYRNYVSLVRRFPLYANYYIGYSSVIRSKLMSSVPQIVKTATTYVTKQKQIQKTQGPNSKVQNHLKNQENKSQATSHRTFNNVVTSQHKGNMIKDLSKMMGTHHQNRIPDQRLSDHKPMAYQSPTNKNNNPFASHTPITYTPQRSSPQTQMSSSYKPYTPQSSFSRPSPSNFASSISSPSQSNFASSNPMRYSGTHSSSLSNTSGMFGGSSRRGGSSLGGRRFDRKKGRNQSFLETNMKMLRSKSKTKTKNFFKNCTTESSYVSCGYNPKVHQVFFGVNIENCN
jgi:hypothetical protein